MKRNILLALVAALTISMVAAGVAFAQGRGPGGNGAGTGTGIPMEVTLSNYMPQAIAKVLGLNVGDVNASLASGETLYTIALAQGYTANQLPALMTSVRNEATALAATSGTSVAPQTSSMLNNQYGSSARGNGAGPANMYNNSTGSTGTGVCDGTCLLQNASGLTGGMCRAGGRR